MLQKHIEQMRNEWEDHRRREDLVRNGFGDVANPHKIERRIFSIERVSSLSQSCITKQAIYFYPSVPL